VYPPSELEKGACTPPHQDENKKKNMPFYSAVVI
jgi:hypothetical protein